MHFHKYHGLGNDYIVIDPADAGDALPPDAIRRICERHYGIGSDGILFGPQPTGENNFGVRIYNPDGSEAEKSGNGLRIFARYLTDRQFVGNDRPFVIATIGGDVSAQVTDGSRTVSVEMGRVRFLSHDIPMTGPAREVINETMTAADTALTFCAANIGNPHCVIVEDAISAEKTRALGPYIENHPDFPNRTNVQFVRIIDEHNIQVEIWERGAGYTLASGSSASASAAVARRLGLCSDNVTVHMPGGTLAITLSADYDITLTGPVTRVAEGELNEEVFTQPWRA
ncbi:MAG: diaminopimelate epimerase [Thermodesulfobacteriota bacterium]